jgi:outer membrane receptor for ferrienterochelin and colicins
MPPAPPRSAGSRASGLRSRSLAAFLAAHLGALALVLSLAATARADDAAMSRFHHDQGSRHYAGGRFERAVHEFLTAQRLSPNPRTVYNIGLCFLRMSRHDDAFFFLDEYLSLPDEAEGNEERRRFAAESLRSLAPRVARIAVRSAPEGASIYVDQREHGSYGVTPRVLALPPGRHRVWIELAGHRAAEASVEAVVGREVEVVLAPERIVGTLVVRGPEGARARAYDSSGAAVAEGALPLEVSIAPGRFEIEVEAEGHRPYRSFVGVAADEHVELLATPERLPQPTGDLTVTASVTDAVVEVDGTPLGIAPLVLADLPLAEHEVTVSAPGHLPWTGRIEVQADMRAWLTVQLRPAPEGRSPLTWVIGGAGVAALIASGISGGLALERASDLRARWNEPGGGPVSALRDEASALALGADVALGLGVTALGAAIVLYFVTDDSGRAASSATTSRRPR